MDQNIFQLQSALRGLGYDPGPIDGKLGPKTRAAASAFGKAGPAAQPVDPDPQDLAQTVTRVEHDPKGLLKGVKGPLAKVIRSAAARSKTPFVVIEGLRSPQRQRELVASGASKTQNSKHLTGDAADLWPLDADGKRLPSDAAFPRGSAEARKADKDLWDGLRNIAEAMTAAAKEHGIKIVWGGNWKSFPDGPHFELG